MCSASSCEIVRGCQAELSHGRAIRSTLPVLIRHAPDNLPFVVACRFGLEEREVSPFELRAQFRLWRCIKWPEATTARTDRVVDSRPCEASGENFWRHHAIG